MARVILVLARKTASWKPGRGSGKGTPKICRAASFPQFPRISCHPDLNNIDPFLKAFGQSSYQTFPKIPSGCKAKKTRYLLACIAEYFMHLEKAGAMFMQSIRLCFVQKLHQIIQSLQISDSFFFKMVASRPDIKLQVSSAVDLKCRSESLLCQRCTLFTSKCLPGHSFTITNSIVTIYHGH